jgi:hypothetical protein
VHQWHQGAHDDVAKHHVEQQLPVGPPGAVGAPAEDLPADLVYELMKVHLRLAQLAGHIVAVHYAASGRSWRWPTSIGGSAQFNGVRIRHVPRYPIAMTV